jgi:hypothetical protein
MDFFNTVRDPAGENNTGTFSDQGPASPKKSESATLLLPRYINQSTNVLLTLGLPSKANSLSGFPSGIL